MAHRQTRQHHGHPDGLDPGTDHRAAPNPYHRAETVTTVVHSTRFEGGFALEQLENERNEIYYRACKGSICRYAEDEYIARMYLEGMGWDPMQPPLP
jgi:hypothetical protein